MTMTTYPKKNNPSFCAHCESEIKGQGVRDEKLGYSFCCDGCLSVYRLINEEGYGSFYSKRINWQEGPVENVSADPDYFESSLGDDSDGNKVLTVVISGIRCAACVWLIESAVSKDEGLISVRVNYANHKAKIVFNPNVTTLGDVLSKFTRLGYCPLPYNRAETEADRERRDYFYRFGTAAFFTMQLMIYSTALYAGYFQGMEQGFTHLFRLISWLLATPVLFYAGLPFFKNFIIGLKHRHFTMDSLVAIGSGSAYLYSIAGIFLGLETYFDTSAMIITLILLGRFIEAGAKQKSGDAVSRLLALKPARVKIIDDKGQGVIVPISQLQKGDLFESEESSSIAADGIVYCGTADLDESMLTGEPIPVKKEKNLEVFAGTRNISGRIIIRATAVGEETFLSKIAVSVDEAQQSKAPIQDVADRFIGKFVPFVLVTAVFTFLGWYMFSSIGLSSSIMKAVSVLVIACPCAMGLATPLAIITASSKLSKVGIIFKNSESIERFALANDFYFDKTGTITEGTMKIADYMVNDNNSLHLIALIASKSRHPASKAIASMGYHEDNNITTFDEIPGKGVKSLINNKKIILGSHNFLMEENITIPESFQIKANSFVSKGFTLVYCAIDNNVVAVFGISDTIRQEAKESIDLIIGKGRKVSILTGDNLLAAETMLNNAKIGNVQIYAGVSPFEKGDIIKNTTNPAKTVMIGDGINDAIALTAAGTGISMKNGTNISIESASAVMLRNDLRLVYKSHMICSKSLRVIKENLFWAFSYNIIAIPLAITGLIHPIMSAVFMSVSSLIVVGNSLRIKKF